MASYHRRNRRLTTSAAIAVCVVCIAPLYGLGSARADTLPDIVRTALGTHPLVSATRSAFKATKFGIDQERAGFLPTVGLSANSGYQRSERDDSNTVTKDLFRNTQRLSLVQMVFDGGATSNRFGSAKATSESARYGLLSAATQIGERAVNAYLSVARDRELVEASAENVGFHRSILDDVSEAAQRGGGAGSRVSQVRTRLLNAQSQRRRLVANLKNSVEDFIEAVGQSPANVTRPELPVADLPGSLEDALTNARRNSFDLRATTERERAAALSADATRGAFLPSVDLELAHERRRNTDGTRGQENDSTALLRLTWDLYTGGRDSAARHRALAERSEARFRIAEVDRRLREELAVALNNLEAAGDQVKLQNDRFGTSVEVRNAYRQQFRLAQRSVLDLLDSSNEQFVAQTDLISTKYDELRFGYEILALSGTLLQHLNVAVQTDKGR